MPEALGQVKATTVFAIEFEGLPLTECRRSHPDINGDIQNRTVKALNVLGLTWRHICEVNPAHCPLLGDGDIHLLQVELVPNGLSERRTLVGLQEHTAVIWTEDRLENPQTLN